MYRLRRRDNGTWLQEPVSATLLIALSMIVRHEVGDRVLQRVLYEEDHSVQTLGFYGAHEALGECI